jgi:hypothetical protein
MGERKEEPVATEWKSNPPLRQGQGEELRSFAGPGDDIVFEANDEASRHGGARRHPRARPRIDEGTVRADDDAQHSRTER